MKHTRFTAVVLVLMMVISLCTAKTVSLSAVTLAHVQGEGEYYVGVFGDADADMTVTVKDATLIQKTAAEIVDMGSNRQLVSDINSDANVNVKDATAIQKFVAGIDVGVKLGEDTFVPDNEIVDTVSLGMRCNIGIEFDENKNVIDVFGEDTDSKSIVNSLGEFKGLDYKSFFEKLMALLCEKGVFGEYMDGEANMVIINAVMGFADDEGFGDLLGELADELADELGVFSDFIGIDRDDFDDAYSDGNKPSQFITLNKAKQIAVEYAGVWEKDVIFVEKEYELDDGKPYYELEFLANGFEFECEVNAMTGEVEEFEKEKLVDTPDISQEKNFITLKEAIDIALEHAGVSPDEASFDDREFDLDDGTPYYELEFSSRGYEYEYLIHAIGGRIIEVECDRDDDDDDDKDIDFTNVIGIDKAKEIALEHAGVTSDKARFDDEDMDDDDIPYYELEFSAEGYEYEYDIHAITGEILDFEMERCDYFDDDDDNDDNDDDKDIDLSNVIGVDKAKEIALDHAGVREQDARFEDKEFELDDNEPCYELEFSANGYEYEYKIHAVTGEVVDFERKLEN